MSERRFETYHEPAPSEIAPNNIEIGSVWEGGSLYAKFTPKPVKYGELFSVVENIVHEFHVQEVLPLRFDRVGVGYIMVAPRIKTSESIETFVTSCIHLARELSPARRLIGPENWLTGIELERAQTNALTHPRASALLMARKYVKRTQYYR